jgi:ribosomal protein S18 acetylase RimI-like enzyme
MTIPDFVRRFWYASMELGLRTERTPWGAVATDHRFPLVWDANTAAVLEAQERLRAEDIWAALRPALRSAGAPYEHVEFWETAAQNPALEAFRRSGDPTDPDVAMVFEGPLREPRAGDVRVDEVTQPDRSFWPWYRDSLREFEMELSEDVLDQLVRRTREVFVPAGLRWFVGILDGERAGYASLLSLDGVGYLDNVVTMPAFRRRGVAGAAVAAAVGASLERGDRHVFLLTHREGDPQRLYGRLGFRVAAPIESFTTLLPPAEAA